MPALAHESEVAAGERFEFGRNWALFLRSVDEAKIADAQASLAAMLETVSLEGRTFLDIGSGSGLFSLAARRMGAARVFSFDYDPASAACTRELKRRFYPEDTAWTVAEGSVLDRPWLEGLGPFDIVYSWGVLHHTGALWQAIENAADRVAPGGRLAIALYNDQGAPSRRWLAVKRAYNRASRPVRALLLAGAFVHLYWRPIVKGALRLRPLDFRARGRGMDLWRDLVDWVGGYPFEVSTPGAVFEFVRDRGFGLQKLSTVCDLGCNEFVFVRTGPF